MEKVWYIYVNTPRSLVDIDAIEVPKGSIIPRLGDGNWHITEGVEAAIRGMASLLGQGYTNGRECNPF